MSFFVESPTNAQNPPPILGSEIPRADCDLRTPNTRRLPVRIVPALAWHADSHAWVLRQLSRWFSKIFIVSSGGNLFMSRGCIWVFFLQEVYTRFCGPRNVHSLLIVTFLREPVTVVYYSPSIGRWVRIMRWFPSYANVRFSFRRPVVGSDCCTSLIDEKLVTEPQNTNMVRVRLVIRQCYYFRPVRTCGSRKPSWAGQFKVRKNSSGPLCNKGICHFFTAL